MDEQNKQDHPNVRHVPDEPDKQAVELGAAVASGWIAPASFPRTTRGRYRTEWDGDPFPVTVSSVEAATQAAMAQAWDNVGQLRALVDQMSEGITVNPHDYNGHVPQAADPEVRRITSAVVKLEALGYRWDAERGWIPPEEDE